METRLFSASRTPLCTMQRNGAAQPRLPVKLSPEAFLLQASGAFMAMEEGKLESWWSKNTVAVATGGNRGLGFGIVCELARRGLTVVLTSRDVDKGLAAVEAALKVEPKASGCVHFHQLDVTDKQSGGTGSVVEEQVWWIWHSYTFEDAVVMLETNYFSVRRLKLQKNCCPC